MARQGSRMFRNLRLQLPALNQIIKLNLYGFFLNRAQPSFYPNPIPSKIDHLSNPQNFRWTSPGFSSLELPLPVPIYFSLAPVYFCPDVLFEEILEKVINLIVESVYFRPADATNIGYSVSLLKAGKAIVMSAVSENWIQAMIQTYRAGQVFFFQASEQVLKMITIPIYFSLFQSSYLPFGRPIFPFLHNHLPQLARFQQVIIN